MPTFAEMLNDMLVSAYNKILSVEEEFLQTGLGAGLTIREMHMIEYVGKVAAEGRTLSEIADFLDVARPSVTVSVRKLEQKGLLVKTGCAQDGRVIRVTLTRDGRKIYKHHMRFHMLMVHDLADGFSEDEKQVLVHAIGKLDNFFKNSMEASTIHHSARLNGAHDEF